MRKMLLTLNLKRALLGIFFVGSLNYATSQVNVVATAGLPAGSYITLKDAFDAINAGTHQGSIAIGISANTTETASAVLNSSGAGTALYTNVAISPTVDGVSISGATTGGRGLIELNGADNVTINGDNPNTGGTNRNLTIQNTAANTVTYTSVIRIALSTLVTTGDNNSVQNCIILGSATGRNIATATSTTGPEHTTYGILVGGAASTVDVATAPNALTSVNTTLAAPITALNFIANNNQIDACARGISVNGAAVTVATPLTVTNNIIGSATAGNATTVYSRGISLQGYNNALVANNTVRNMEWFVATAEMGISLGDVSATGSNAIVEKNIVNRVFNRNTGTYGAYGINIAGGTNHIIRTNSVADINHDMTGGGAFSTTFGVFGIRIGSGTGHQVYHNSVNLFGARSGTATASLLSAACAVVGTGQTGCDIRNNIFTNTMTGGTTSVASVSLYLPTGGTSAMNLNLNNNAYYCGSNTANQGILQVSTTASVANLYLPANFIAGAVAPATNSRSYTSLLSVAATNDDASYASSNAAPYTSSTDLHLDLASPELSSVEQKGVAGLAGVATDFDGQSRPDGATLLPDMGFDEVTNASCSGAPTAGAITGVSTICAGNNTTLSLTGSSLGAGITYQWASSTVSGGPYTNMGTSATQATGALATTTYYVATVTCTNGGLSATTVEFTVNVNANPVVSVTPSSATYCNPGTAVSLTASGAVNYAWTPSTGLSATIGATVSASPSATTTYTVTGVDGNSCIGTALVTVTVVNTPTISSATATPSSVCSGGSSQLNSAAAVAYNQSPAAYSFAASAGTYSAITGTPAALVNGDDTGEGNLPIGFTFNYNGAAHTVFSVNSNGYLVLSQTTTTNTFTNNLAGVANVIAPLWDDNNATGAAVVYSTTGVSPNQVLTVQWTGLHIGGGGSAANPTIDMQIRLYEATGVVEIVYGATSAALAGTTASIGISGAVGNYLSVTPLLPVNTSTVSSTVQNSGISSATNFPSGTIYTFTPPVAPVVTYLWSPATFLNSTTISNPMATGISSTITYDVTASYLGCTSAVSQVTIAAGSALTSSASITPSSTVCAGTAVTISATGIGGGAPYTYAWTGPNGFTSTSDVNPIAAAALTDAGLYTVTVTDNCGATSVSTVTLTVNTLPVVSATPPTSLYCAPGTGITLTANGASTYTWSPAAGLSAATGASVIATPSANTTYTVTGTDGNGCTATATAIVNSSIAITSVTATALPTATCDGNSVLTASAAFPAVSYCQPVYANGTGFGDYISSVQLNTLNNATVGAAAPYYTLFPTAGSTTTTLTAGATYTITLSPGTYTQNDLAAWIDFNQNGTLNDATEKLGETNNVGAAPATTSFTFTVPLTASNGPTRLRVRDVDYGGTGTMDPCAADSPYGETEDYTITIVGGVDPYTVTWSPATYLSSTSGLSVSASGIAADITYTATATTAAGCANSNTATITVLAPSTSTTTVTDCDSYTWTNGTTYTVGGTYTQVLTNAVGCDSTATLVLTINNSTSSTTTVTACDTYTWTNGTTYTVSGTDVQFLTNAAGCDSTATLVLTINNSTTSSTAITACDSYTWTNGTTYTMGGTYTQVLTNAAGCDSTATLVLTINNSSTSTTTVTDCDSYTWTNGTTYTMGGTYTQVLTNAAGCDSTATLILTINNSTTSTTTVTDCDSYTWTDGTTYTVGGTYSQILTNAAGCDSTATLALTLNFATPGTDVQTACDSYTWINGTTYTSSNSTATFLTTTVAGCDSLVTLNLTITTSPTAVATDNGDATITASAGTSYQWIDCGTGLVIAGATAQTYTVTANGSYAVVVNNGACDDTSTCVVIDYIGIKEITQDNISVFPNPTRDFVTVNMTAATAAIEVVDAQGKILQTSNVENGGTVSLSAYETGMYIFRITTENGTSIHRISKN